MRISCLHTTQLNIPIYEAAAPEGVKLIHHVRSDLLYRARQGVHDGLRAETNMYLRRMAPGSDAVLMTCSILAEAVSLPAFSADDLLAQAVAAAADGRTIDVFYTNLQAAPTIEARYGDLPGAGRVQLVPVAEALERLFAGDTEGHDRLVRDAVTRSDADLRVLVQATMQPAVPADPRILAPAPVALARLSMMEIAA